MRRAVALPALLVVATGQVLAHSAHGNHAVATAGVGLFLLGCAVLGTSVFLDARGRLARRYADLGVFLGVANLLVGVVAMLV